MGIFASAPKGWVDGLPHQLWMQREIAAAKKLHGFCLRTEGRDTCPRHGTALVKLDGSAHSPVGCERCMDELSRVMHALDLVFARCRVMQPPRGAMLAYGGIIGGVARCANPACQREFTSRTPAHRYCSQRCQLLCKRERARRKYA